MECVMCMVLLYRSSSYKVLVLIWCIIMVLFMLDSPHNQLIYMTATKQDYTYMSTKVQKHQNKNFNYMEKHQNNKYMW